MVIFYVNRVGLVECYRSTASDDVSLENTQRHQWRLGLAVIEPFQCSSEHYYYSRRL